MSSPLSLRSRRTTIIQPPMPELSSLSMMQDDRVDFIEVRRAVRDLESHGLLPTPELVRIWLGRLVDLPTLKEVLVELA